MLSCSQTADKPSTIKGQVSVISPYLLEPQHISSSGQRCPYPCRSVLKILVRQSHTPTQLTRQGDSYWGKFYISEGDIRQSITNNPEVQDQCLYCLGLKFYKGIIRCENMKMRKCSYLTHFCPKPKNKNSFEIVSKS